MIFLGTQGHQAGKFNRATYRTLKRGNIGISDACQGDSGGPIWRTIKHPTEPNTFQAVLVGLVKTGYGVQIPQILLFQT